MWGAYFLSLWDFFSSNPHWQLFGAPTCSRDYIVVQICRVCALQYLGWGGEGRESKSVGGGKGEQECWRREGRARVLGEGSESKSVGGGEGERSGVFILLFLFYFFFLEEEGHCFYLYFFLFS